MPSRMQTMMLIFFLALLLRLLTQRASNKVSTTMESPHRQCRWQLSNTAMRACELHHGVQQQHYCSPRCSNASTGTAHPPRSSEAHVLMCAHDVVLEAASAIASCASVFSRLQQLPRALQNAGGDQALPMVHIPHEPNNLVRVVARLVCHAALGRSACYTPGKSSREQAQRMTKHGDDVLVNSCTTCSVDSHFQW